jgi:hypothetical protein
MHRTIASATGGYDEELTPEEEAATVAEWKKNAEEQAIIDAAQAEEDRLANAGADALTADLPPAEAAALKRKLGV